MRDQWDWYIYYLHLPIKNQRILGKYSIVPWIRTLGTGSKPNFWQATNHDPEIHRNSWMILQGFFRPKSNQEVLLKWWGPDGYHKTQLKSSPYHPCIVYLPT